MSWRIDFLNLLRVEYKIRRQKNPRYSIRAFARDIGVSPGPTSQLIKGTKEWKFSERWALRILDRLALESARRERLLVKMGIKSPAQEKIFTTADQFILSDWTYIPILMSFSLPTPHNHPKNIAKKLGIREANLKKAVTDLCKKGWLEKDPHGEIKNSKFMIRFSEEIKKEVMLKFHDSSLDLAKKALKELPSSKYDFQSFTLVGNADDFEDLRKEIKSLIAKATAFMNRGDQNNEVFRINVSLFPLNFSKSK